MERLRFDMKKLIVLDLDGTILRDDKTVSEKTIETLIKCKKQGNSILFATARPPRDAYKYIPQILRDNPIICYNGACIISSDKLEVLYKKEISREDVENIIDISTRSGYSNICLEIDDRLYSNFDVTDFFGVGEDCIVDLKTLKYERVYKIILCNKERISDKLLNEFPKGCRGFITDGGTLCQIISSEASKWTSVKYLAQKLDINEKDIIAFGDDYNDYDMIKNAGIGVAMKNGEESIKNIADYVTDTNMNDGVARFLEEKVTRKGGQWYMGIL